MTRTMRLSLAVSTVLVAAGIVTGASAQQQTPMTFFVTSVGKGSGADLGGLDGADAHCNALAKAAGSTLTNWRAYLSTTAPGGDAGVNARDRIGKGPWYNSKGALIAKNVADLHSDQVNVTKQTALTEKGEPVKGSGEQPNEHDMLTGSDPRGSLLDRRWRHHLRQLDQERGRLGHCRPSRPRRLEEGHAPHEVVELLPRLARLQPGAAEGLRRRRPVLLLRRELRRLLARALSPRRGERAG